VLEALQAAGSQCGYTGGILAMQKVYIDRARGRLLAEQNFFALETTLSDAKAKNLIALSLLFDVFRSYLEELVMDEAAPMPKELEEHFNAKSNKGKKVSKSARSGRSKKSAKLKDSI